MRTELPGILATRTDALSPRMLHIIEDLTADWRHLDVRIEHLSSEIEALARQDKGCERPIPGGSVRQGETPEVSVRRELAEEIGLVANAPSKNPKHPAVKREAEEDWAR